VHVGYETWEEHLAIVLGIEVRGLLWSETQPSLLQEVKVTTDGDLQVHGQVCWNITSYFYPLILTHLNHCMSKCLIISFFLCVGTIA